MATQPKTKPHNLAICYTQARVDLKGTLQLVRFYKHYYHNAGFVIPNLWAAPTFMPMCILCRTPSG